jgi:hypothetical protein
VIEWFKNGALVAGIAGTTYSFAPTATGTYTFYVLVTDASGAKVMSASLVVKASTESGSASGPNLIGLLAIGALSFVVTFIIGMVPLLLLSRRRAATKRTTPKDDKPNQDDLSSNQEMTGPGATAGDENGET